MNLQLTGWFTMLSPLSHIGETISTTAYLVQEPMPQPDGTVAEVFCYSGNAWRGQLRDLSAAAFLDLLQATAPPDLFHLLFSGGKIGGDQVVDIEQAMRWRRRIPHLSLFGGGIGNQILAGKLKVSNAYPLCRETAHLYGKRDDATPLLPYAHLTFEKSFSRKDDSRDGALERYQADRRAIHDSPEQMRMTVELLAAGTRLHTTIHALDLNDVEFGCLMTAITRFARSPFIGGQANRGHGHVALAYACRDLDTHESIAPLLDIHSDQGLLQHTFVKEAMAQYRKYVLSQADTICTDSEHGRVLQWL